MAENLDNTFAAKFLVIGVDNKGPIFEEDKFGVLYPTYMIAGIDLEDDSRRVMKIASCIQSNYLKVGNVVMSTTNTLMNNVTVIEKSSTLFSTKSSTVDKDVQEFGNSQVRAPVAPFVNINHVQTMPVDEVTSVTGFIRQVEDVKEMKKKLKKKRVRDIILGEGSQTVRITLWDICADLPLKVGDEVEFHDIRVKDNSFNRTFSKGLTTSLARTVKISDGDADIREYTLLSHDVNSGRSPNDVLIYIDRGNVKITANAAKSMFADLFKVPNNMIDITLAEMENKVIFLRVCKGIVIEMADSFKGRRIKVSAGLTSLPTSPMKRLSVTTGDVSTGSGAGTSGTSSVPKKPAAISRPLPSDDESLPESIPYSVDTPVGSEPGDQSEHESTSEDNENVGFHKIAVESSDSDSDGASVDASSSDTETEDITQITKKQPKKRNAVKSLSDLALDALKNNDDKSSSTPKQGRAKSNKKSRNEAATNPETAARTETEELRGDKRDTQKQADDSSKMSDPKKKVAVGRKPRSQKKQLEVLGHGSLDGPSTSDQKESGALVSRPSSKNANELSKFPSTSVAGKPDKKGEGKKSPKRQPKTIDNKNTESPSKRVKTVLGIQDPEDSMEDFETPAKGKGKSTKKRTTLKK